MGRLCRDGAWHGHRHWRRLSRCRGVRRRSRGMLWRDDASGQNGGEADHRRDEQNPMTRCAVVHDTLPIQ